MRRVMVWYYFMHYDVVHCDMALKVMLWHRALTDEILWCGVVWCGVVWCGVRETD